MECLIKLEDTLNIEKLIKNLPDNCRWLKPLAERFQRMGLCHLAMTAYMKSKEEQKAVDVCISLGEWQKAVKLIENKNSEQMNNLIQKHANELYSNNKLIEAVELYRNGGKHMEAANILQEISKRQNKRNPVILKKIHVMIALEIEQFRKSILNIKENGTSSILLNNSNLTTKAPTTAQTLAGLIIN